MERLQIINQEEKKNQRWPTLSLAVSLSPSNDMGRLWTGPLMDIHNMIYNTSP